MKLKFRTNLGSRDAAQVGLELSQCQCGCEAEVGDEAAQQLIDSGVAEMCGESKATEIKGIPKEVGEVAAEKATSDLKSYRDKQVKKSKSDDK